MTGFEIETIIARRADCRAVQRAATRMTVPVSAGPLENVRRCDCDPDDPRPLTGEQRMRRSEASHVMAGLTLTQSGHATKRRVADVESTTLAHIFERKKKKRSLSTALPIPSPGVPPTFLTTYCLNRRYVPSRWKVSPVTVVSPVSLISSPFRPIFTLKSCPSRAGTLEPTM